MNTRRMLEWGGLAASVVLIIFGAAALYMGFDGRSTVQDSLKQEQIFFGEASDPAVAKHADQWAGQQVKTGEQARAFAQRHARAHVRVVGRAHLRADGPVPVGSEPERPEGHERRGGGREGRQRPADRQRRPATSG